MRRARAGEAGRCGWTPCLLPAVVINGCGPRCAEHRYSEGEPPGFKPGQHVRVVDGPLCGDAGVVVGTLREGGGVVVRGRQGLAVHDPLFLALGN